MKKPYHIVTRAARESAAVIEQFCQANGQILLPILKLIENASQVVESVIHQIGHQILEQVLVLSAEQVAGARTPGKASGEIRYHGSQPGRVQLADRKVKVKRPRLRHKTKGEVKIPAYEKLRQDRGLAQHLLGGAAARGLDARIPGSLAADGRDGGSLPERHQPPGDRGERRTTATVAGAPLGGRRDSGDLHRWPAFRRASRHRRGGRTCGAFAGQTLICSTG